MVSRSVSGYNVDICDILTVHEGCAQMCGYKQLKINDDGISMLKQACSRRYSGSLKLKLVAEGSNAYRIKALLSLVFDHTGNKWFGVVPCSNTREFGVKTTYFQQ